MINPQIWNAYYQLTDHKIPPNNEIGIFCNVTTVLLNLLLTELDKQQQSTLDPQAIADFNKAMQTLTSRVVELAARVKNLEQSITLLGVC